MKATVSRLSTMSILLCAVTLIAVACQPASSDEIITEPTMVANLTAFVDERVRLNTDIIVRQTEVSATIAAYQDEESSYERFNQVLVLTARANQVPTPPLQVQSVDGGSGDPGNLDEMADSQFDVTQVGVSLNPSYQDECGMITQPPIPLSQASALYVKGRAVNLPSQTRVNVDWVRDGTMVYQSAIDLTNPDPIFCFAIPLTSSQTMIDAGNWSVTLFINGSQVQAVPFEITP